jgi:hypothetical protein
MSRFNRYNREYDRYHGDVSYEVWRDGGNPDTVDYDKTTNDYYSGLSAVESASSELRRQRNVRAAERERREAEEYERQQQYDQYCCEFPRCDICGQHGAVTGVNGYGVCSKECANVATTKEKS